MDAPENGGGEEMTWKQFLTEKVLHEPEATSEYTVANNGDLVSVKTVIQNRTFDNRNDLMDLYETLYREMKWFGFRLSLLTCDDSHAFCLYGEGYEQRCKMVAEFYGWEEKK